VNRVGVERSAPIKLKEYVMERNLITISKFLSKHLRHAPEEIGLTLQAGGWVAVDDLLAASERAGFAISYDDLIECVETNDKQRFSFDNNGDLIRANQGHSVEVDLQLEPRTPPICLFHGTVERFMESILADGLRKGKRHHVHLSTEVETARRVGARRGKPVILRVDAGTMHEEGFKFFLSPNGVWLTDSVPTRFLARI
jgi:putative RNA 2'-phosphotransferase